MGEQPGGSARFSSRPCPAQPAHLLGIHASDAASRFPTGGCRCILLTCKRFLRVQMSDPAVWRQVKWSFSGLCTPDASFDQSEEPAPRPFAEQDSYLRSKLRLLQRVAGGPSNGSLQWTDVQAGHAALCRMWLHAGSSNAWHGMAGPNVPYRAGLIEELAFEADELHFYQAAPGIHNAWQPEEFLAPLQPAVLRALEIPYNPPTPR